MLDEIRHLCAVCLKCIIELDGGVTVENAKRAVDAGANVLVVGSYIFCVKNIEEVIKELKNV